MKRVSIKDVAKEAGVSTTTVSYVLNRHPGETISAETTQRVLDAAKRLNYVPNLNARSLSSRHTNLIGVVIPQTEPGKEFMFSNPFYGELLSAIDILPVKAAITYFCPAPGGSELCEHRAEPGRGWHHHRGHLSGENLGCPAHHWRSHRAGGQLCDGQRLPHHWHQGP